MNDPLFATNEEKLLSFIEDLDRKFQSFHSDLYKYKKWNIHDWIYYGNSFGVELILRNNIFTLRQMLESGYVVGSKLLETEDISEIQKWTDVFAPTKDSYKTDRK